MSKSIEISPKYGVNPTIPVCFWCGEEKNEIALMGRVRERNKSTGKAVRGSDLEIPKCMVLDYDPCDSCAKIFAQGLQIIEVELSPIDNRPPIIKDSGGTCCYPTGKHIVIRSEAAERIFNIDKSKLIAGKKLCLDSEGFTRIMSMVEGS